MSQTVVVVLADLTSEFTFVHAPRIKPDRAIATRLNPPVIQASSYGWAANIFPLMTDRWWKVNEIRKAMPAPRTPEVTFNFVKSQART